MGAWPEVGLWGLGRIVNLSLRPSFAVPPPIGFALAKLASMIQSIVEAYPAETKVFAKAI